MRIRSGAALTAIMLAAWGAPAVAAVNEPPVAPVAITVDSSSSFVAAEGLTATPARVEVWRGTVLIGRTGPMSPTIDPTLGGIIEVNHAGGLPSACWVSRTPAMRAGDSVRVIQGEDEHRTTVRRLSMQPPARNGDVVTLAGEALDLTGTRPPLADLSVVLRNTAAGGGGGVRFFAPPRPVDAYTATIDYLSNDPADGRFEVTFDFNGNTVDAQIAADSDEASMEWIGPTASEIWVTDALATPAPQDPCTVAAQPAAVGPQGLILAPESDSGVSNTDRITNVTSPTVRAVTSEPGVPFDLLVDGVVVASGTSAADGLVVAAPPPLADGARVLNLRETLPSPPGTIVTSNSPLTVTIDTTAASPTGLATTPASPGSNLRPALNGTAEPGATVDVYAAAACAGPIWASGTAVAFAQGLSAAVPDQTVTTFSARLRDLAGNVSACSAPLAYQADAVAPRQPGALNAIPSSGNPNAPTVRGNAEAGSTVRIYLNDTCAGTPIATATAAVFAAPGIPVAVPAGTTSTIAVTVTDAAGNVSPCAVLRYRERVIGRMVVATRLATLAPGRRVKLLVRCQGPVGADCSGLVDLVRRRPVATGRPPRDILLGRARVSLRSGQTLRVTVTLTTAARAAVLAAPGRSLTLRIVGKPTGGIATVGSLRVLAPR